MNQLQKEITNLKKTKNAVILAHNYQNKEIIEIADFIGDSFELAQKAMQTTADIIAFCGVKFMAESAKLLNPDKKVLLPDMSAGCFMADRINSQDVLALKQKHPKAKVVAYVNTSVEVKAQVDICCTSANALKIIENLDTEEIIFLPDRNLADFIQKQTTKKIIPFTQGYCFLHTNIQAEKLLEIKKQYPSAELLMHPETPLQFHQYADFILGTGGMINHIKNSNKSTFLIATEKHMSSTLKHLFPKKDFIPLMKQCNTMKKITLENTFLALKEEQHEITIKKDVFQKAQKSLKKMIKVV